MFNFAERFWAWKKRRILSAPIFTEQGFKVLKFGDKWAVRGVVPGTFKDLVAPHTWTQTSPWFRDCLASKEEIEKRFGKIIEKEA